MQIFSAGRTNGTNQPKVVQEVADLKNHPRHYSNFPYSLRISKTLESCKFPKVWNFLPILQGKVSIYI